MSAINWKFLPTLIAGSASNLAISAGDSFLTVVYKLQSQVNALKTSLASYSTVVLRGTTSLSSSGGTLTIDLGGGNQIFLVTLTENITAWAFTNLPASGLSAEIEVEFTQVAAGYAVANPASGRAAGGFSAISSANGAIQTWSLKIDSAGVKTLFQSGVYA